MEEIGVNQILLEILNTLRSLNDNLTKAHKALEVNAVPDAWLHEDEVMKIFSSSRKTLYNWRQKDALQSKKFGRYVYYLKSEVYKMADIKQ